MAEKHRHASIIEALGERAISNRLMSLGIDAKYVTVHNWKREGRGIPDSFRIRSVIAEMARAAEIDLPQGEFPPAPLPQPGEAA